MSLVMLVFSVAPILAPLGGSALIVPFGWRSVFVAVTLASLAAIVLLATQLPETRPKAERVPIRLGNVLTGYGVLLRDQHFLGLTFIGGLGMASFFAFLASSSFVYIDHFGLSPTLYSLAFSINAVGFFGASQFSANLGARFGMHRVVLAAVVAYAFSATALLLVTLAGATGLATLIAMLFVTFACLGLVIPTTMVLSLEDHGPIAGMASALGGTLQMASGAVMMAVVSAFFDGTATPMVSTIALCAAGALVLALMILRRRAPATEPCT
jgi:DHA1 family bicyclomycin/chloramphenicol resistance-like MFS transporter